MPDVQARPTIVHGARPVEPRPITAERYISESWLARERNVLWSGVWQFACLERDVVESGQYVVLNIARESILVSCTQDGDVAAHYNVCQHRGARVMVNERGCEQHFTCPNHGWSYRTDGRLVVGPDNNRFPGGVNRTERSLKPVRVGRALGMVWICMDPEAPLPRPAGRHHRAIPSRRKLRRKAGPRLGWDYGPFTDGRLTDIEHQHYHDWLDHWMEVR